LIASILDNLATYPVENPGMRIREIIKAITVFDHNPLIGCPEIDFAPGRHRKQICQRKQL
jgi:hypothetical protein